MTSRDDSIQVLMDLGLTESQATTYFALLRLADSKATTIAKFSKVARQDIYRLLSELQQLGLVQKIIARPTRFRATPAKEAVHILLNRKKEDFSKLEEKAKQFAEKAFESFGKEEIQPEDQFVLVTDRDAVILKANEAISNAKNTVNIITPLKELAPWLATLAKPNKDALYRGVHMRWIVEKPEGTDPLPTVLQDFTANPNFKLKMITNPPKVKVAIHDKKYTMIGIFASHPFSESPALWSNNPALAELAENYFEDCWKTGTDVKPKKGNRIRKHLSGKMRPASNPP